MVLDLPRAQGYARPVVNLKESRAETTAFLGFFVPPAIVQRLDELRQEADFARGIPSRSEMLRTLVLLGLEALEKRQKRRRRRQNDAGL